MNRETLERELAKFSPEIRNIAYAITLANRIDENKIIDDVLKDVRSNRSRYFDFIMVDLSIDRSSQPLEISGSGTYLTAAQATDDLANVSIAFEYATDNAGERITLREGKDVDAPYNKLYIYHEAQAGKTITLMRAFNLPSLRIGISDQSGESANSDLNTALGNSSGFTPTQASVTTSDTSIIAANTARKRVTLVNAGTATVYINDGVATTSHFPLLPGAYLTLNTTAAIKGISASGTQIIGVLEE